MRGFTQCKTFTSNYRGIFWLITGMRSITFKINSSMPKTYDFIERCRRNEWAWKEKEIKRKESKIRKVKHIERKAN